MVIEAEVLSQRGTSLFDADVFFCVNLFVLHAAPQALGEDVVLVAAAPIHADFDAVLVQHINEHLRGKLCALIGVVDVRRTAQERLFERLHAEAGFHVRR